MSRSGYSDEDDDNTGGLWRGAVASAIRGKRGQSFLKELLETLDALPTKRLVANSFQRTDGEVCALGCVGAKRGIDMTKLMDENSDYVERYPVAKAFGIAEAMAAEIMFENDDDFAFFSTKETPEQRFTRVRNWVVKQIAVKS